MQTPENTLPVPEPIIDPPRYDTPTGPMRTRRLPAVFFYRKLLQLVWNSRGIALRGAYDRNAWSRASETFFHFAEAAGARLHIENLDYLAALEPPVVFVANHMSTFETFTLPGLLLPYTPLSFVVKESLVRMPIFGPVMRATRPVVVTRKDPRHDLKTVLTEGVEQLHAGTSICLFPQTTRSAVFRAGEFNTLGVKLAARAGVPVVPIALKTDFWSTGGIVRDFGPIRTERDVHFAFGPPMDTAEGARQVQAELLAFLTEHLEAWGTPCEA